MGRKKGSISKKNKYQILFYIPKLDVWIPTYKVSSFKELSKKLNLSCSTINKIYNNKEYKLNKFVKIEDLKSNLNI